MIKALFPFGWESFKAYCAVLLLLGIIMGVASLVGALWLAGRNDVKP